MSTAIAGIGRTEYSRNSGRTTMAMAAEACRGAVADTGLDLAEVDGMICFQAAGDSVGPLAVSQSIGLPELAWSIDMNGGGNVVANVIATAAAAIEAGLCRAVVAYRSLNGRSGYRFGTATGKLSVGGPLQFEAPHGYLVPPQWIAMWAKRHQHVYGSTCEDLGQIATTQRAHAVNNPHAINRTPLTMDDYMAGRWINEPFRIFDCAYEIDRGGGHPDRGPRAGRLVAAAAGLAGGLGRFAVGPRVDRMGRPDANVFALCRPASMESYRAISRRYGRRMHV